MENLTEGSELETFLRVYLHSVCPISPEDELQGSMWLSEFIWACWPFLVKQLHQVVSSLLYFCYFCDIPRTL